LVTLSDLILAIILQFYLLSASFRLRLPMPPVLPQAEMSRRRLVDVVRKLDVVKRKISEGDIRHLLIFAYILAMQVRQRWSFGQQGRLLIFSLCRMSPLLVLQGLIQELEFIGRTLQDAFGVISQTAREEFEALFV
jgi:hypothetical protein